MFAKLRRVVASVAGSLAVAATMALPAEAAVMNLQVEGFFQAYFTDPNAVFGEGSEGFDREFSATWQYNTEDVVHEPDYTNMNGKMHRTSKVGFQNGTITISGVTKVLGGGQAYYTTDYVQIAGGGLSLFGLTFYPDWSYEFYTDLAQPGQRDNGSCADVCFYFAYPDGVQGNVNGWTATTSFAPVPEPSTWALMIAGFGLAGTALRRRRTTGHAAGCA